MSAHTSVHVQVRDPHGAAPAAFEALPSIGAVKAQPVSDSNLVDYTLEVKGDLDVREHVFDAAVQHGFKLLTLEASTLSLEDVFVHITTQENEGGEA